MRKPEELKTERKTVLMPKALAQDIEQEAAARGIKPNAVMNERLAHSANALDPKLMAHIQNIANTASRIVSEYAPSEAKKMQMEVTKVWTSLNKNV